jgi:hypothetical protein
MQLHRDPTPIIKYLHLAPARVYDRPSRLRTPFVTAGPHPPEPSPGSFGRSILPLRGPRCVAAPPQGRGPARGRGARARAVARTVRGGRDALAGGAAPIGCRREAGGGAHPHRREPGRRHARARGALLPGRPRLEVSERPNVKPWFECVAIAFACTTRLLAGSPLGSLPSRGGGRLIRQGPTPQWLESLWRAIDAGERPPLARSQRRPVEHDLKRAQKLVVQRSYRPRATTATGPSNGALRV